MIERRVLFTATARDQVERERGWWQANRDHVEAFAVDLESAVEVLKILPGVGTSYAAAGFPGLRRLYLRRIGCHVHYTFDDRQVVVRRCGASGAGGDLIFVEPHGTDSPLNPIATS